VGAEGGDATGDGSGDGNDDSGGEGSGGPGPDPVRCPHQPGEQDGHHRDGEGGRAHAGGERPVQVRHRADGQRRHHGPRRAAGEPGSPERQVGAEGQRRQPRHRCHSDDHRGGGHQRQPRRAGVAGPGGGERHGGAQRSGEQHVERHPPGRGGAAGNHRRGGAQRGQGDEELGERPQQAGPEVGEDAHPDGADPEGEHDLHHAGI
jgi:hypothetical protein